MRGARPAVCRDRLCLGAPLAIAPSPYRVSDLIGARPARIIRFPLRNVPIGAYEFERDSGMRS
jgi:hypothetical protein